MAFLFSGFRVRFVYANFSLSIISSNIKAIARFSAFRASLQCDLLKFTLFVSMGAGYALVENVFISVRGGCFNLESELLWDW